MDVMIGAENDHDLFDFSEYTGLLEVPQELHQFGLSLRQLKVVSTELRILPQWLGDLENLRVLQVNGKVQQSVVKTNHSIPGPSWRFQQDGSMSTIVVQGCPLEELPECVGALTKLDTLDLRGCTGLRRLPGSVANLRGLHTLDLSGCSGLEWLPPLWGLRGLSMVPMRIQRAGAAQRIVEQVEIARVDLSGHSTLLELPADLRSFEATVRELMVASSKLEWLPHWLGEFKQLEVLRVNGTGERGSTLKRLPESVGELRSLTTLDLGWCVKLEQVPASVGALKELRRMSLYGCRGLTTLPESVRALRALEDLSLAYCLGLLELPKSVWELTWLQTLYLEGCHEIDHPSQAVVEKGEIAVTRFLRTVASLRVDHDLDQHAAVVRAEYMESEDIDSDGTAQQEWAEDKGAGIEYMDSTDIDYVGTAQWVWAGKIQYWPAFKARPAMITSFAVPSILGYTRRTPREAQDMVKYGSEVSQTYLREGLRKKMEFGDKHVNELHTENLFIEENLDIDLSNHLKRNVYCLSDAMSGIFSLEINPGLGLAARISGLTRGGREVVQVLRRGALTPRLKSESECIMMSHMAVWRTQSGFLVLENTGGVPKVISYNFDQQKWDRILEALRE